MDFFTEQDENAMNLKVTISDTDVCSEEEPSNGVNVRNEDQDFH